MIDAHVGPFHQSIRLDRAMKISTSYNDDGAVVAKWEDVPIVVRCATVGDALMCLPIEQIPPSKQVDRQTAGQIRIACHNGKPEKLRED
jgi:hypothetical protein